MQPIRSVRHRDVLHDPWSGTPRIIEQRDDAHALTDEGAIRSCHDTQRIACVCGCVRPVGGFCAVCSGPVCVACYSLCRRCSKPCCPRHSVACVSTAGQPSRLCAECAASGTRKELVRRIERALLSPFVEFDRHEGR